MASVEAPPCISGINHALPGYNMPLQLDFLLRSKTYSKERPPSASTANKDFPLSSNHEHVVRLVYTHYKVQIMLLHSGLH